MTAARKGRTRIKDADEVLSYSLPRDVREALLNKQCLTWGLQGGGPSRRQAFLASPQGKQAHGTQEPRGRPDSPPALSSLPTEANETLWIHTLYTIQHPGRFHTQKLISSDYFRSPSTSESSCHHLVFLQILSTFCAPVQVAALPSGLWTESRESALGSQARSVCPALVPRAILPDGTAVGGPEQWLRCSCSPVVSTRSTETDTWFISYLRELRLTEL